MTRPKLEIFVVEDDAPVRDSLSFLLTGAGYDVVCFADSEALKAAARTRCPACILLDVNLPGRSGLEILGDLRESGYPAPVVMMTGAGTIEIAVRALKLGARDFIEKPFTDTDLLSRLDEVVKNRSDTVNGAGNLAQQTFPGRPPLTKREQEVFQQLLMGRSNYEISKALEISPRTTEVHRASILRKLGARNTAELVRIALTQGDESSIPATKDQSQRWIR